MCNIYILSISVLHELSTFIRIEVREKSFPVVLANDRCVWRSASQGDFLVLVHDAMFDNRECVNMLPKRHYQHTYTWFIHRLIHTCCE